MFASKRSRIPDDRDSNLVKPRLEDHPEGFPRIAAYQNSDTSTALYRRFGNLHARSLLYKEIELTSLEAELAKIDNDDGANSDDDWRIGQSIHHENGKGNEKRKALIEEIDRKMEIYDNILLRDNRLRSLRRPSERVHRDYMDYIYTEQPFIEEDLRFIYHEQDFVTVQEYEDSWLDYLMHRFITLKVIRYIFVSRADRYKTSDPHVRYYSAERLGTLVKIIISVCSIALLLIPIYLFLTIDLSTEWMASITLIFAFLFATAMSLSTNAKRQEVFAATAAYCAVLVVFIGNLQQKQWSGQS